MLYAGYETPVTIHLLDWFGIRWQGSAFLAGFAFYVDKLTLLWMLFVTGLGTLIALYASEYMESDVGPGYARFFAGISVFLFAMIALVRDARSPADDKRGVGRGGFGEVYYGTSDAGKEVASASGRE